MEAKKIYRKFEATVSKWEKELDRYSEQDLVKKPRPETWSIGQVYEHITASTLNFHAKQIERCLQDGSNRDKGKSWVGFIALVIKRIPPIPIKIPAEENFEPLQPSGKTFIKQRLQELRDRFSRLAVEIDTATSSGKVSHPGMGYLLPNEWFELIEMHLRYHWKHKVEVDRFLENPN